MPEHIHPRSRSAIREAITTVGLPDSPDIVEQVWERRVSSHITYEQAAKKVALAIVGLDPTSHLIRQVERLAPSCNGGFCEAATVIATLLNSPVFPPCEECGEMPAADDDSDSGLCSECQDRILTPTEASVEVSVDFSQLRTAVRAAAEGMRGLGESFTSLSAVSRAAMEDAAAFAREYRNEWMRTSDQTRRQEEAAEEEDPEDGEVVSFAGLQIPVARTVPHEPRTDFDFANRIPYQAFPVSVSLNPEHDRPIPPARPFLIWED